MAWPRDRGQIICLSSLSQLSLIKTEVIGAWALPAPHPDVCNPPSPADFTHPSWLTKQKPCVSVPVPTQSWPADPQHRRKRPAGHSRQQLWGLIPPFAKGPRGKGLAGSPD